MKFSQNKRNMGWAPLMPLAFVLGLVSCGESKGPTAGSSGSSNSSASGGKAEKGPATGRLLDTAVGGVAYVSPSGSGTTDEKGTFKYNHGDTIEFKLGSLILGKSKGAGIMTPMELAGGSDPRLHNLLI